MKEVHLEQTKFGGGVARLVGVDQAPRGGRRKAKVRPSDADRYIKILIANGFPPAVELLPDGRVRLLPGRSAQDSDALLDADELNDANDDGQFEFEEWKRRHEA
jgi:hypothetical protein